MPKKMNIAKNASAMLQNETQIKKALKGLLEPTNFAFVEKNLGSAQFTLKITQNKTARGTPRGLFTRGTMCILPGQVVIVEGDLKNGFEIVASMDRDADEVTELIKSGYMPADILPGAIEEDGLFDRSDEDEDAVEARDVDSSKGNKAMRKQAEQRAAIKARLGMLKSGRSAVVDDIDIETI